MDASILESVEPIIKKLARKYWFKINWEYEDLLQEGRLAALKAFQDWTKYENKRMASLSSLVYLYVTNRFKELSKKAITTEILIDNIDEYMPQSVYFENEPPEPEDEILNNDKKEIITCLYEILPQYAPVIQRLVECNLSPLSTAVDLKKTRQRISQIKNQMSGII
jgi:RNA polymerase sigma factor (sigma-70 family)